MKPHGWTNIARCASLRYYALTDHTLRLGEWQSWMAAQELTGRSPF